MAKESHKVEQIKALVATARSRMIGITNVKKDGTERNWNVNLNFSKGLKGDAASESAQRAVATRKENNPNLINVVDMNLYNKGTPVEESWRSINCETVTRLRIDGVEYEIK